MVAALSLVASGELTRIKPDVYYAVPALEGLKERIVAIGRSRGGVTVAELRDALGVSRKYSLALLEHLDAEKLTLRHGDRHLMRGC